MPGKRSGAERSKPRIVLDLKVSDVLARLSNPLLNFLNAYATVLSHKNNEMKDKQLTVSTLRKSFTLQFLAWIRETIRSRSGSPLAIWVNSCSNVGWSNKS